MKILSEHLDRLRDLYINQLQHLHSGEQQIVDGLPKMIEFARTPELKLALENHLRETRQHVVRLEQILVASTKAVHSKKNRAISALLAEGEDVVTAISIQGTYRGLPGSVRRGSARSAYPLGF